MPQKNTLIEVIFLYGAILKQALSQFEKVHIEYEYPLTLEFVHSQHHLFAENIEIELLWKFSLLKRVYFQKIK